MKTVELGSVAAIERNGVDPSSLAPNTLYLGLEHIERGGRIIGHDTVGDAELRSTKFQFTPEHVLFSKLRPNLGKISRPGFVGVCSTDILPIRPGKDLDRDYLAHYLSQPSMVEFATSRTSGANLPRLSPTVLATFPIPLPPLNEQHRIAAILDNADSLRAKRRQVVTQLGALGESLFEEFFRQEPDGWSRLSEVAEKVVVGHVGPTSEFFRAEGVPFLRTGNVGRGEVILKGLAYVTKDFHQRLKKSQIRGGDVLISRIVTDEVRAAVAPEDLAGANCANIILVRPSERLLPSTVLGYLGRAKTQRQLIGRRVGSAQGVVNTGVLKDLLIPIYPVKRQQALAARVEAVSAQRAAERQAMFADDQLFASLQSRAFRGEL